VHQDELGGGSAGPACQLGQRAGGRQLLGGEGATIITRTLTETETIAEQVRGGGEASSSCHHPCHHHDGAVGVEREDCARMSQPRLLRVLITVKLSIVVRFLEQVGDSVTGQHYYQSLCVVTDMGDWCSRCPAQQRCRGCLLSSQVDRLELVLKPGDNFAIKFAEVE
jgi:hypothetical protein